MNWLIVAIVLLLAHKEYLASPTPLKLPGLTKRLTPYIKHWEAANYDRIQLHEAHQKHIEQKRHRRKRELQGGRSGAAEYGPAHTIRLNFFAHDREFRLILRQDPLSVFSGDVEIENQLGPMDYDITRIYTGSLEDDENSYVHAILTSDNLLDGTIETNSEHYYLEPAHRYSHELPATGVHSIVYRVSDVNMHKSGGSDLDRDGSSPTSSTRADGSSASQAAVHCASERLRRSMLLDDLKRRKANGDELRGRGKSKSITSTEESPDESSAANTANAHKRRKRWLPDELSASSSNDHQNPPLPLDLDVPYNDDFSIFKNLGTREEHDDEREGDKSHGSFERTTKNIQNDRERILQKGSVITWRDAAGINNVGSAENSFNGSGAGFTPSLATTTKSSRNRNIIVNSYNPNAAVATTSLGGDNNYSNGGGGLRKTYTKHKNIIVSTYNNRSSGNNYNTPYDPADNSNNGIYNDNTNSNNFINNFFNTNWTTMFNANDRPSHKTHVEIITKNGATKKPNIIVNNYNPPDITLTPTNNNNQYPNFNSMLMSNVLSGRGQDGSGDGGGMHGGSSSVRALYDRKITCMLYLQADHTFFQKMGSDEASIEAITRHVQRANTIYKNTDFNNDGKPDNITFMIKRIKVHNMNALKDPAYRFPGNYGVEKFLELFSEEDYDAFCLAYMFTYRDFEMGTLGLAWTGDLKNAGGVCEKNGHYRGSLKSLNTGIVTLLNYGKHVPPAVSHVTLAHEIGHNFGSPHDPEQCTPGGEDGNFIMFARATSGDKKNNNKFSPCSLKSIEPVLNAKARSIKGCFTEPQTSICGNGVVEPGEQCDCGWEEDCKDSCCFPMSRHPRIDEKPCTLTPRTMCSPSQGPCCTTDCKLKFGDKCRDDNGCRDPSFCDGRMPQCPPSVNKPNKTICNKEFVCYMGDCTGSICLAYGLESCQCIPGPKDDKIKSCELCCKLPGEDNPCRSSFEWNEPPFDVPDMYAKPGTPCNDYNGYCDVFQKCREVDPSGPLATLRKLLLSEESIASFKKWIQHNWYTVALAVVGVFVLLILSTKLLAKRSNLKLKSVTIIHSATTETVRLPDDNNGVIVHTAVRTKVPFKKKVRGERSTANKLSKNNNNSGNLKTNISAGIASKTAANRAKLPPSTATAEQQQLKKPTRTKKNRVAVPPQNTVAAGNAATNTPAAEPSDPKKAKKFKKKQSKEIIDYSARDATNATAATGATSAHTNTFGKVQRWLLESPIVAQPLSHIEHSSKIRKVMSKSQSTPERLVQQTPQKTKSMGNLANDKVKLQVVYKPPFKFSLRLSKNAKVKTHVIGGGVGGAVNKMKRKTRTTPGNAESKRATQAPTAADGTSKHSATKRTALLLRSANKNGDEDNQILTLNEPNYETLNQKTMPSKMENPFYENMQYTQVRDEGRAANTADGGQKISRSSSKTNLEAAAGNRHNYSRSNSLTAQNPFAATGGNHALPRKLSECNSINLSRNFGSTQNLINASQSTNLAKSKKRSSLNLKASKNGKDPPKRSNSNMNLRRDSSATQLPNSPPSAAVAVAPPLLRRSSSSTAQQQKLPATSSAASTATQQQQQSQQKLPTYAAQRAARASISNIPRASLSAATATIPPSTNSSYSSTSSGSSQGNNSAANNLTSATTHNSNSNNNFNLKRHSPPATITAVANSPPPPVPPPTVSGSCNQAEHRRSRNSMPSLQQQQSKQRSNSIRQHQHNHHPPPLPKAESAAAAAAAAAADERERELPSDLEVMVSDVENLVS